MDTIGLDLHKRESQLCIGHDDGTVEERRIVTSRERFTAVLGSRAPARILLEASTESEWVARHLEQLGHEVIVADPNFAAMYATRSRRTKTDRRDARTLMEACRLGAYRPAHRLSAARRHVRAELAVREALVRTRTRYIALAKALVRRDGLRVAASESHLVGPRIAALELSDALREELAPLFALLTPLNAQIAEADTRIAALTAADPAVALLTTAPTIGPITAAAIVATIDDVTRLFPRLGERMKQEGGTLSGGEQQMLAIGRALMARPRLLLLDEPSLGIAPKLVAQIFEAIETIAASGVTILLVEQNTRLALRTSRRAYVLRTGEVALTGESADLTKDPEIQAAYFGG